MKQHGVYKWLGSMLMQDCSALLTLNMAVLAAGILCGLAEAISDGCAHMYMYTTTVCKCARVCKHLLSCVCKHLRSCVCVCGVCLCVCVCVFVCVCAEVSEGRGHGKEALPSYFFKICDMAANSVFMQRT